ncbi:conserved hypothetical protein [Hirschia baltica ATCC 49814]|uniref:Transglycosylase SLT domain-containing protein n=2 Tax=Hirschia TaxID=2723 RepID=C6XK48_HIRBI|nr:conserved hypothetical protein [Hirschia baltica ATCC 49814]
MIFMKRLTLSLALTLSLFVSACASAPPKQQENACKFLKENKAWYRALRSSAKKWGAPIGLQLAIIRQESSFEHKAKPDRGKRRMLGLLPGKRPSSAYGYAQALDGTWNEYKKATGNNGAERYDFDDATDFIGWYVAQTGKRTGISQYNYRGHYLAYHEGAGGYLRGSWKNKNWLINTANRVHSNADRYETQVQGCKKKLQRRWLF